MEKMRDYTLIIPTYNRNHLFKQLISYLTAKRVGFKILVLDSSDDIQKTSNKIICNNSVLDINYFEYDSEIDTLVKFYDGLKRVDTKYVSFCADDDLLLTDTIPDCIAFLEKNEDYVACHGYYLNIGNENKKDEYNIGLEYDSPSLDAETFEERIFQLLNNYQAIFYAVFKRYVIVDCFNAALKIDSNSSLFRELFTGIAPLVSGKVKRLKSVYYVRARRTFVASADHPGWEPNLWFADNPDSFVQAFTTYREIVKRFIAERTDHNIDDWHKFLSLVHAIYFYKSISITNIQRTVQSKFEFDSETAHVGKKAFIPFLHHVVYMIYRRIFSGEHLLRRKAYSNELITFIMTKNISKSIMSHSVLIDLQKYISDINEAKHV